MPFSFSSHLEVSALKQYICLSSEPWGAVPTRTQQLMTRLRGAEVLFFEPPASGKSKDYKKPGRKMRPGLTVYTLPSVLEVDEKHTRLFALSQRRLAKFILDKLSRHRFRESVLWTTSPGQVHLLDLLPCKGVIYDCDRAWSAFPLEWESDLALSADVIFAASPGLIDRLSPCNDNLALLPGGVNYPMFSRDGLPTPPELRGVRAPVLGWAGTIHRDTDLTPALQAVRDLPDCAFVFVGAVDEKNPLFPLLREFPNVAFTGFKPLVDLPDYLGRFDVCLDFLRRRDVGSDIIPCRIYEYLSTGKPIVSMLYEDQVEEFPDVIYGAHTPQEYAQLCQRALSEAGDWARRRRRDYGEAAAWSVRADEVCRILGSIGLY